MIGPILGMSRPPKTVPSSDPEEIYMVLESRIEALELSCAGLWDLLKARHGYTDEEIAEHIRMVDLRDGRLDGKTHPPEQFCPNCKRKLLTRSRKRCVWCGVELAPTPF